MADAKDDPKEVAECVVDAWEQAEGESMREGHRETLVRLIAAALTSREKRFRSKFPRSVFPGCR